MCTISESVSLISLLLMLHSLNSLKHRSLDFALILLVIVVSIFFIYRR